jgi:restriction endonuclease Mrr
MDVSTISITVSLIALAVAALALFFAKQKEAVVPSVDPATLPLQLQAYERLVLLSDRISIPNLVSRTNDPQMTAREMQRVLVDNIKQEIEYNTSQQIYVSPVAWNAVQNLKDQNLLIINQISNVLPPDAKASDLNKQLLEVIMAQKEKALHTIVLEALNVEAKKVMSIPR